MSEETQTRPDGYPKDKKDGTYMFKVKDWEAEWNRLDQLHIGIRKYMNGKLTFAPLDNPQKILEVGSGSGAWAIQAAQMYPDAEIVAADMTSLPPRPLPKNLRFQKLNILDPFPFQPEEFDAVHFRLVLFHLPNARDVVRRAAQLLKPGGWLLVEDLSLPIYENPGPAQERSLRVRYDWSVSKGLDPYISVHMAQMLEESYSFDQVETHKPLLYSNPLPDGSDPTFPLAEAVRVMSMKAMGDLDVSPDLRAAGYTRELQDAWKKEMNSPVHKTIAPFTFTWARKSVSAPLSIAKM
ncbi:S-adenosyl-L-methionine-dependent methyltransferase [Dentipellis sp. KUC8613]|nr:S-adenosyl-L-methionine-dependent methyltransferase [Dentipellis sp. KUC8613]